MTVRQQFSTVIIVLALIGAGVIGAKQFFGHELSPLGTGTKAPDFQAVTLDAPVRTKTLADYKGQVVLLNIWATWCGPCRAEMPSMQALEEAYGTRGLKIVAVSIDDPGMTEGIRAYAKEMGITFEVLHDPNGTIQRTYQTTGIPESVLIGRDGVIRNKTAGATDWNSPAMRALVEQLLAEQS